jgi:phospholipid/cholesterol/gamma-HCH transport system ATP-binding protein
LSLAVPDGQNTVIIGYSGSGKSVTLKCIVGLLEPDAGRVVVDGETVQEMDRDRLAELRGTIGYVFQFAALFDSLTIGENVAMGLRKQGGLDAQEIAQRVEEALTLVDLPNVQDRFPAELSGGMRKRVGIARAIALRPKYILYDEPTTGLDPITALTVDDEIIKLRDLENVSSLIVTHQLRDAFYIATHRAVREGGEIRVVAADDRKESEAEFLMLRDGRLVFEGDADTLRASNDPYLKTFLS